MLYTLCHTDKSDGEIDGSTEKSDCDTGARPMEIRVYGAQYRQRSYRYHARVARHSQGRHNPRGYAELAERAEPRAEYSAPRERYLESEVLTCMGTRSSEGLERI